MFHQVTIAKSKVPMATHVLATVDTFQYKKYLIIGVRTAHRTKTTMIGASAPERGREVKTYVPHGSLVLFLKAKVNPRTLINGSCANG